MPIEIQELIISATVAPENQPAATTQTGGASALGLTADQKEALIQECAEQVLEIIRKQTER
jgi:Family of unknown function (DUF5908)